MQVRVSFYSYFKDLTGCSQTTAEIHASATVEDLLKHLATRFPKLEPMKKATLVAVGVDYQPRDYVLKEQEEVSLFPPVQGG
jgi:molybdopterin converting factor small subunit